MLQALHPHMLCFILYCSVPQEKAQLAALEAFEAEIRAEIEAEQKARAQAKTEL